MAGTSKSRPGRRSYRDLFLAELTRLSNGEAKLINSRVLRDNLEWDEERFGRIKQQLKEENAIITGRGGPGGAVALAGTAETKTLDVFISYCHADEKFKDDLIKHLSPLRRLNLIADWHDRKIDAGDNWGSSISKNLDSASIILLLVSIDFINSKYCYDIELDRALERADEKSCVVIPIILRSCMWQHSPFSTLQALPKDARAVASWPNQDDAFVNIAEGIKVVAEKLLASMA